MPLRDLRHQAAVVRDHHILLIRVEDHDQARSYWLLPGGGREGEESDEECIRREVWEETHLDVRVDRILFEKVIPPNRVYERVRTYVREPAGDGEARPGEEPEVIWTTTIVETGWFDLRSLDGWPPAILEDLLTMDWINAIRSHLCYR